MQFKAQSVDDLEDIVKEFKLLLKKHECFAFNAQMGAGKTTFISTLLKSIGVEEEIASPTFGYVKEYSSNLGLIYHFDVYRLEDEMEGYDIGMDEYLASGNICLIEWPERIENLLPENTVWVNIRVEEDNSRTFEIEL